MGKIKIFRRDGESKHFAKKEIKSVASEKNPAMATPPKLNTATAMPPKLARRSLNKHSTLRSGRTIGEERERLETASERTLAREKSKKQARRRIIWTVLGFLLALGLLVAIGFYLFGGEPEEASAPIASTIEYSPSVEVFDEDLGREASLTARMRNFIGQAEADFQELGYTVTRVVIPTGAVREVDFYLDGVPGFLKLILDRETGVLVEDADRVLKYLKAQGIADFTYIDLRLEGRAYWK